MHFYINPITGRLIKSEGRKYKELTKRRFIINKDACLYDIKSAKRCLNKIFKSYPNIYPPSNFIDIPSTYNKRKNKTNIVAFCENDKGHIMGYLTKDGTLYRLSYLIKVPKEKRFHVIVKNLNRFDGIDKDIKKNTLDISIIKDLLKTRPISKNITIIYNPIQKDFIPIKHDLSNSQKTKLLFEINNTLKQNTESLEQKIKDIDIHKNKNENKSANINNVTDSEIDDKSDNTTEPKVKDTGVIDSKVDNKETTESKIEDIDADSGIDDKETTESKVEDIDDKSDNATESKVEDIDADSDIGKSDNTTEPKVKDTGVIDNKETTESKIEDIDDKSDNATESKVEDIDADSDIDKSDNTTDLKVENNITDSGINDKENDSTVASSVNEIDNTKVNSKIDSKIDDTNSDNMNSNIDEIKNKENTLSDIKILTTKDGDIIGYI